MCAWNESGKASRKHTDNLKRVQRHRIVSEERDIEDKIRTQVTMNTRSAKSFADWCDVYVGRQCARSNVLSTVVCVFVFGTINVVEKKTI